MLSRTKLLPHGTGWLPTPRVIELVVTVHSYGDPMTRMFRGTNVCKKSIAAGAIITHYGLQKKINKACEMYIFGVC